MGCSIRDKLVTMSSSGAPASPGQRDAGRSPSPARASGRLSALDGLRGLAAVVVFAHHALVLLYGPLAGINPHGWQPRPALAVDALHHAPVAWLFNGAFAVSFFFVLSGFVLTRAMGHAPSPTRVAQLVAARFLRLLPLAALGTVLGYFAFDAAVAHLDALLQLTGNDSSAYIHPTLLAHHGMGEALRQLTVVIWGGTQADHLFDPPLWSIGVELKGSLLVYLVRGTFVGTPNRLARDAVALALGLCLFGTDSVPFVLGMALADRSRGDKLLPLPPAALAIGVLAALSWASVHPWNRALWLPLPVALPAVADSAISAGFSAVLMAAGLQLRPFRALLDSRPVQALGHASYGLYVAHVPILYLGVAPLLAWAHRFCPPGTASLTVTGLLFVLCVAVGHGLITYVDTPLARFSKARATGWLAQAR